MPNFAPGRPAHSGANPGIQSMPALQPVRRFWCALALRAMLAAMLAGAAVSAPFAQTGSVPLIVLRPEIATPLQAAQELARAGKFVEALARIREAEAVPERTPGEILAIDRMRGVAAAGAGDVPTATRSFEAVIAAGGIDAADRARLTQALALLYFQSKDFPKAATWAARYLQENGTHADMRWLLIRAQYLADDWASAARELRVDVDGGLKSGVAPPLERVQLLANSYTKLGDNVGYVYALEALLAFYPKKEYWADAIRRVETKPGFADRLALDALRLRQATGVLSAGADYTAMAELAMAAALPAEAKRVADQGFASGALGTTGADADKQKRLRDTAAKQVAEDQRQLPQSVKAATAAPDGTALVNVGFVYVSDGQFDQGIALMEQGMQKGGLSRPDEAKLHLAIAYLAAGQKAKAIAAFRDVGGTDGTADLARLWSIHAQRP
jgi:Tfp pilus assembly protein PilF